MEILETVADIAALDPDEHAQHLRDLASAYSDEALVDALLHLAIDRRLGRA